MDFSLSLRTQGPQSPESAEGEAREKDHCFTPWYGVLSQVSFLLLEILELWVQTRVSGRAQHCVHPSGRPTLDYSCTPFAGPPAGSLLRMYSNRGPLPHLCSVPSIIIGGLTGKEKKDNSIRIPFSTSTVSTVGRGWLWGCKAAPSYYCAWLSLSMTRGRQYSTPRAWGMNSKYEAWIFLILSVFP